MLNNRKIGTKIAIGIISIILIISGAMGLVYYKLKNMQNDSTIVVHEYLPEVDINNDLLEETNVMMYNMRGYALTGDQEYYDIAMEDSKIFEEHILLGENLVANSEHLVKFSEQLVKFKAEHQEYYNFAQETKTEIDNLETINSNLDYASTIILEKVNEYLDGQESKFETNIELNDDASALSQRLFKITKMNEVLDYINDARISNFKAMITKDANLAKTVVTSLDNALVEIEKIVPITINQSDIDFINEIKNEISNYEKEINKLILSYDNLGNLATQRETAGSKLLLDVEEIASIGINNTKTKNEDIATEISAIIKLLLMGLVIALIVGAIINIYIVKKIVKDLNKMVKTADILATGNVDVEMDINSKDEVGMLAESFNKLISNIKNQVYTVEQIADGNLEVAIEVHSDEDLLNIKLTELKNKFKEVIKVAGENSERITEGALDIRIDEDDYNNEWKSLVMNINSIANSLEAYIKSVPTTIMALDKDYNVKYLNDFGLNLTKTSLKEAKQHKCFELMNTNDCNTEKCASKRAMNQDVVINASTQSKINGEVYDIDYDATALKNSNGDIIGAFEIINDKTAIENNNDKTAIENNRRLLEKRAIYQNNEVSKLVVNLNELLKGNLKLETGIEEFDEDTSEIAKNFKEINDSLGESTTMIASYVSEISNILQEIGNGNLNQEITSDYRGDFAEFKVSLNQILENLNEAMSEITVAADEVATGSNEVARSAEDLSQGSTEQASAIEQINSSIVNVAEQTNKNAENAKDVNKKSNNVMKSAEEGTEKMNEMIEAMDLINKSSKNIGKIISVIDNIAFQTNILALNAAVEAERAGKYGKGFAVVAEEVRNLAGRSANAAKDTTELIEDSIEKIEAGTKTAEQTGVALKEIVTGIKEVSSIIEQIAIASDEQAVAVGEINEGLQQVTDVTQSNTATAEEASAASEEMSSQAEILNERVSTFELRNSNKKNKTIINQRSTINLDDDFGKY